MGLIERIKSDVTCLKGALRTLKKVKPIVEHPDRVLPVVIEELADRFNYAPALLSDHERFTYRELAARANRYARWALESSVRKGDTVCLLMPNRPEYMAIWVGVTRVGGVVALLNTNLSGHSLAYCVNIVEPRHIIVAAELWPVLASAQPHLAANARIWLHGEGTGDFPRIDDAVGALPGDTLSTSERRPLSIDDRALYIYTSGTTGLPKAANVNHYRLMLASHGFAGAMDALPSDRMYDCLPMYHTVGGVVATGAMLASGGSTVIREKFSAREFWDDLVRWDCTLLQYIGELCRYLLNTPESPSERRHRVRLACGNGLRPDVWPAFRQRFGIPEILEFYAATEGNCTLFNFESKEGAVGRLPWFLARRFPIKVVRFDVETEQPVRDGDGSCIECGANETGEVIGRILNDPAKPGSRFEGYAEKAATEKKILRDVFEPGDAWFRSGDLMRKNRNGYFFFVDRVGDTFRWKGENVATSEVSEAITAFPGIKEANVYGVTLPGHDGRVGMAAVVADDGLDLAALRRHLQAELPAYARPMFLRLAAELDVTGTFKLKKGALAREGFDPAASGDPIFFDDPDAQAFVRLDATGYDRLVAGGIRLWGAKMSGVG